MKTARGILLPLALTLVAAIPAGTAENPVDPTQYLWQSIEGPAPAGLAAQTARTAARPRRIRTLTLNRGGLEAVMAGAPLERTRAARERTLVLSLPAPGGEFERFAVQESPVMEPALAAKHPDIKTYSGRGLDNPASRVRFDITPLGFHASVRGPRGSWYIDPSAPLDQSLYQSYFGRDVTDNPHGVLVERSGEGTEISADRGFYHAPDTVTLRGAGFAADAPVVVTITAGEITATTRTVDAVADAEGAFEVSFVADPDGHLGMHQVEATDTTSVATGAYDVVSDEDVSVDPPIGDQLRTYRVALLTDPSYATYFGGPANVTPAKVTLINRVTQVYEDETSIRLVLIGNNDVLNLDTPALMTGANGPCGGSACFTAAQAGTCGSGTLTRNRIVIGLLAGASNFDVGHIALGLNGGGVASLGVVGGNGKAQGCTGLPFPVGDFFAVDYVAHEMGHQFAGNHTFNGTQSNCSGGNRNAGTSVEPGSGSSIMAYAGICQTDNLQPHSDPYWSQRSLDEITTYTSGAETNINEVQMGVLAGFDGTDSFQLRYNGSLSAPITRGTNFNAAGIQAAIVGIAGWPVGGTAATSAVTDTGFTVTFGGTVAGTDVSLLELVSCAGCTGYVGEIAKGGPTTRRGTVTATGNHPPVVTAPAQFTIPLRTPFALTGSATDEDGDPLTYMWEQNDRGAAAGTSLVSNTKANGPLFRQFGTAAVVSATDTLLYESPGENAASTNPTRIFPDLTQILANNTNAETGLCPAYPVTPPTVVPPAILECYSEFLPTATYVGFAGVNASPLSLHFRLTARDGRPGGGGVNNATTTLLLAPNAGPFLVTGPNTAVTYAGASSQTITWDVASTNVAPVNATDVRISLSVDGGHTYAYELTPSTPNDGSEALVLPNVATTQARVKVEAVGNVFFDVSNADFTIQALPIVTNSAPGGAAVQYSDSLSPAVTVSASDADSAGSTLVASVTGLPAGLSLAATSVSDEATRPGSATWTVVGKATAGPGTYNVTVTVTDDTGGSGSTSFAITVTEEDAEVTYSGDSLAFTSPGATTATVLLRATVRDGSLVPSLGDSEPGDITNATVSFKEGGATLCGPLPLALLDGTTSGTASCSVPLWPGVHAIDVEVDHYYTGATTTVVEIVKPEGSFVGGAGLLVLSSSAGSYKATAGSKAEFALDVKYNPRKDTRHDRDGWDERDWRGGKSKHQKDPKEPKGHIEVLFRAGSKTYLIKSSDVDLLGVSEETPSGRECHGRCSTCIGLADIRWTASLVDVTKPWKPVSVASDLALQVTVTDKGDRHGSGDSIGITLWNGNALLFSSKWNGSATLEQLLKAGKITVN
jgi:trimeric autotransporter adhesin